MLVETAGSAAADAPAGEAERPRPSQGSGSSQPLAGAGPASAARLPGRERSVAAARALLGLMLELFGVPPGSSPPHHPSYPLCVRYWHCINELPARCLPAHWCQEGA